MKTKLAAIDDDRLVTDGLELLLSDAPDIEWVGAAHGAEAAIALVREKRPEVVLMDVLMPGGNGILVTELLLAEFPSLIVIGCSTSDEIRYIERIQEAGARGYLLKEEGSDPIVLAVTILRSNPRARYLSPRAELILKSSNRITEPKEDLTEQEIRVLELKCEGYCTKEVAVMLNVAPRTVYKHIEKIKEKSRVEEILQLYPWAVKKGYLTVPKW